jgi:hypothetical protein
MECLELLRQLDAINVQFYGKKTTQSKAEIKDGTRSDALLSCEI